MKHLQSDTIVGRGSEHVETRSGDQTLMMSIEHGKYYSVDATAARIWELIEHPAPISQIVSTLAAEYEVDPDDCDRQVKSFLAELIENGLAVELEGASES